MDKISCSVIQDLMPLYVDDVLSEDSKLLVSNHMKECLECKQLCEMLKEPDVYVAKENDEATKAIKSIQKKINHSKATSIGITAAIVLVVVAVAFYFVVFKQSYVPYEKSGIVFENDDAFTQKPYYCFYGYDCEDQNVEFVYLSTTIYENFKSESDSPKLLLHSLNDSTKQVYYISEDYSKHMDEILLRTDDDEYMEKIKEDSTLIWESDDEAR